MCNFEVSVLNMGMLQCRQYRRLGEKPLGRQMSICGQSTKSLIYTYEFSDGQCKNFLKQNSNTKIHAEIQVRCWKCNEVGKQFVGLGLVGLLLEQVLAKVGMLGLTSVVMTTELSLPPRWLANTEPTPQSWCFTVFLAVFLGAVSCKLPLTSAEQRQSSKCPVIRSHMNAQQVSVGDTACPPPRVRFPTRKRQDCRDSLGTVLSKTVMTVSLSASPSITCSEQLARMTGQPDDLDLEAATSTCFQLTTLALTLALWWHVKQELIRR